MKRIINPGNAYIALWMAIIVLGDIFSNHFVGLLSVFALMVSTYYTIFAITQYHLPKCFTFLHLLLVLFTIYGVFFIIKGEVLLVGGTRYVQNSRYLSTIYESLLPIYSFYVLTRQGWINEKSLRFWIIIFFFVAGFEYYSQMIRINRMADAFGISVDNFNNNLGYLFVALIPGVAFFYKKPILQVVLLIVITTTVLYSLKRGAILIGLICLVVFLLYLYRTNKTKQSLGRQIVVLLFTVGFIVFVYQLVISFSTTDAFSKKWEITLEGNLSGRDEIVGIIIDYLLNKASFVQLLFGSGARASVKYVGIEAHNDWLEIAMAQGLIGVIVYFLYWIGMIKEWKSMVKHTPVRFAFGLLVLIYFERTLFSMSYNDMPIYATCILGYCLAISNNKTTNPIHNL